MIENTALQDYEVYEAPYISLKTGTRSDAVKLYNLLNTTADKRIMDVIGSTLEVKDVIIQRGSRTDTKTGEMIVYPRITLIDKDGITYSTNSIGIYHGLQRAITMFGEPTWDEPVKFEVAMQTTRSGYKVACLKAI